MISLFLMTEKGYRVLEQLRSASLLDAIDSVIIGKDKKISNDSSVEIKNFCIENDIIYHYREDNFKIQSQYALAVSWQWLIEQSDIKLIILHDSLLPKYRGFAPLVNQLINGEKETGVTAVFAKEKFDTGEIIIQRSIELNYPIKIATVIELVSDLYGQIACEIIAKIVDGEDLKSIPQNESQATYSLWRDHEDYRIDWTMNAETIKRFVDAVGPPYNGASCLLEGVEIKVAEVEIISDVHIENRQIGKVLFMEDGKPIVVCGSGLIKLAEAKYGNGKSLFPLKKHRTRFK